MAYGRGVALPQGMTGQQNGMEFRQGRWVDPRTGQPIAGDEYQRRMLAADPYQGMAQRTADANYHASTANVNLSEARSRLLNQVAGMMGGQGGATGFGGGGGLPAGGRPAGTPGAAMPSRIDLSSLLNVLPRGGQGVGNVAGARGLPPPPAMPGMMPVGRPQAAGDFQGLGSNPPGRPTLGRLPGWNGGAGGLPPPPDRPYQPSRLPGRQNPWRRPMPRPPGFQGAPAMIGPPIRV